MSGVAAAGAGAAGEAGVVGEEAAAKAVAKRYEGLVTVRNKAVKGKGAWYWAHLEPLMVHNHENGLPKAVKLKCCLCHTIFSASNPSRTASEHLKRGTCPHFSSPLSAVSPPPQPPPPLSSLPAAGGPPPKLNHRKRSSSSSSTADGTAGGGAKTQNHSVDGATSYDVAPISVVDPSRFSGEMGFSGGALVLHQNPSPNPNRNPSPNPTYQNLTSPVGSGGGGGGGGGGGSEAKKFEESVKKLKGPNKTTTVGGGGGGGGGRLSKGEIESALENLSDWVYESCGSVSLSSLEHPKFKSFLNQVGMIDVCKKDFVGSRLDSRFDQLKNDCDSRIRNAMFFQIGLNGWNGVKTGGFEDGLVSLIVNLPNGTSVYRRAVFVSGGKVAEDVVWEMIVDICGQSSVNQCVGVVADKGKKTVLKDMESRYGWMINLSCQCRAFDSLVKDFYRELSLFKNVALSCQRFSSFVKNKTLRNCILKYQSRDCGGGVGGAVGGLFRANVVVQESSSFEPVYVMIEDIVSSARVLQLVLSDESYKIACMEDLIVREFGEMMRDVGFWTDLEAVRSLVRLVKELANEFETERPLVGQCLPLWEELRTKVKDWCAKFHIADISVDKVIERRFRKNYHPAWAAAYILDPFYMIRDSSSGKYLPPFKYLSSDQQKDVHDLVTKLVSREEVPIALSELMRWRSDGLDPVYAQAVQLKQRDPNTGKMRIANPQGSRLVWETYLPEFESLGKVALRLIFLHATARGFNCNTSILKWVQSRGRSKLAVDKAQKMIFIAAHSKFERRDFTSDEDKDAELFGSVNGEDDVLNEVYVDP
ncbi:hypothetical protein RND81_06G235700 [Saponaria officinalis]|uniref:DUF7963 domain-containing protein n=1 Tax=Saponaria officinalis TaxID=3572 RepID=A0AAW1KDS6_SAPOF